MKRHALLWLTCLAAMLAACNRISGNESGDKPLDPASYGERIGTYQVENRNMSLQLFDITDLYQEVHYGSIFLNLAVPVRQFGSKQQVWQQLASKNEKPEDPDRS